MSAVRRSGRVDDVINGRSLWYAETLPGEYGTMDKEIRREVLWQQDANLVGSRLAGYPPETESESVHHLPVLDLDYHADLVPSSTPGHFHLYLDRSLSWEKYEKLLKVLAEVGILEKGYVDQALIRKQSFVRLPGTTK